jgi:DNA-damage-inducible protein D
LGFFFTKLRHGEIMKIEVIKELISQFESTSHKEDDVEFWLARELQELLGYSQWRNFVPVIEKAKAACRNAGQDVDNHFADARKTINLPKTATRDVEDIMLTRYACYLIAQNGDPRKEQIAFAMSYFAVQTRKQEVLEQRINDWERLQARDKLTLSEREFSGIIYERGVDSYGFARIRSKGDQALFGGNTTQDMKSKMGVSDGVALADFLPTITIKAKDFAIEITNFNIKRDDIYGEDNITNEHVKNNLDVRSVLSKSGIKPEQLPAETDTKKLKRKMDADNRHLLKGSKGLKEISGSNNNDEA